MPTVRPGGGGVGPPLPPSPGTGPGLVEVGAGITTFGQAPKRMQTGLTINKTVTGLFAMRRDVVVNESPIYLTAGETRTFTVTFEQAQSVSSTSAKIYKSGTDSTATYMSGSTSVSGNVVTLPTIQSLVGGERYVVEVAATVDGQALIKALLLIVRLAGSEL